MTASPGTGWTNPLPRRGAGFFTFSLSAGAMIGQPPSEVSAMIAARIVMLLLFCAMAGTMLGQWPGPHRVLALSQTLGLDPGPEPAAGGLAQPARATGHKSAGGPFVRG